MNDRFDDLVVVFGWYIGRRCAASLLKYSGGIWLVAACKDQFTDIPRASFLDRCGPAIGGGDNGMPPFRSCIHIFTQRFTHTMKQNPSEPFNVENIYMHTCKVKVRGSFTVRSDYQSPRPERNVYVVRIKRKPSMTIVLFIYLSINFSLIWCL